MKYDIDKEMTWLPLISGGLMCRIYPLVNFAYSFIRCDSDKYVTVKKISTPGYKGDKIPTLIIEPKNYRGELPCIMFFHGGGYLMKAFSSHYKLAKWYAVKAHCKVVMPDYRLMPKYKYPVAIEDCYQTYMWVLKNAKNLDINKDKIIAVGDSAGGNIASAITVMLYDRKQPLPKGLILIYPVVDKRMGTESMKRFTDTPIWDSRCTKLFWDMYLDNQDITRYASISEIYSLSFYPDTYIEVADFDSLRDEGIEFAKKLRAEGVSVVAHKIKRTCHGYEAATKSSIVRRCMKRRIKWINRIFENDSTEVEQKV